MCCLLSLILCQYYSIIVGHYKIDYSKGTMIFDADICVASGLIVVKGELSLRQ